jgi:hypothetical protein
MNATPAKIDADREQIRMLVLNIGYAKTSEQTGIKQATLRQWASRGQWFTKAKPHAQAVATVTKAPADVLTDELQQNEKQTRLSLSRYTAKAAKDSEGCTIRDAKLVKAVADTADKTFQWSANKGQDQSQVAVNIAILGV